MNFEWIIFKREVLVREDDQIRAWLDVKWLTDSKEKLAKVSLVEFFSNSFVFIRVTLPESKKTQGKTHLNAE